MRKEYRSNGVARTWKVTFPLVVLAILAAGYVYYRHEAESIRQAKYVDIAAIAQLKAGQILDGGSAGQLTLSY